MEAAYEDEFWKAVVHHKECRKHQSGLKILYAQQ